MYVRVLAVSPTASSCEPAEFTEFDQECAKEALILYGYARPEDVEEKMKELLEKIAMNGREFAMDHL